MSRLGWVAGVAMAVWCALGVTACGDDGESETGNPATSGSGGVVTGGSGGVGTGAMGGGGTGGAAGTGTSGSGAAGSGGTGGIGGGAPTGGTAGEGTGGVVPTGGTAGEASGGAPTAGFPVAVSGSELVYNDGSGRRYFAAGMVDNRPTSGRQLERYDHAEMDGQCVEHTSIGANSMRWNTFLRGIDLRWDASGNASGMVDGAVAAIVDGLDTAQAHGITLQLTLATGHFLQYGSGDATENATRVNNCEQMFTTEAGTQAYIDNVLIPILDGIGPSHPALLGYLIINEAHAMVDSADTPNGSWTDVTVPLVDIQRFINRVAGTIHARQPGALVTTSSIARLIYMWEDAELINAGGDPLGTLDWHQVQFYPDDHIEEWSPFERTAQQLIDAFGGSNQPVFCGEFPLQGMVDQANRDQTSAPFGLAEAYERLWNNGISGGYTWSIPVYAGMDPTDKATTDAAYTTFAQNHL